MNAEQVKKQLTNMENFIMKEAKEKVAEINERANSEFTVEKTRLVSVERKKIKADFERKKKQLEVKNKIAHSNKLNQARLRKLKAREDIVLELKETAKERLAELSSGRQYEELLKLLIIQGLIKLQESKVSLRCRPEDEKLVNHVLPEAIATYKARTNNTVEVSVDRRNYLPSGPSGSHGSHEITCAGGILLSAQDDRIICDNTLDQRLTLAFDAKIPDIRRNIFREF
eukprot:TRINITY_DN290_c0_g1_i1.p1 TRINITY_DN290_c0_g1~~TRINITY_DN290_c0_g1_i1.p1  ORF type:complete len:255 (+),score=55.97 TRINITY_DN290_c0_g1_i1:83-766(+)